MSEAPAPAPTPVESSPKKVWRAGTLTYSGTALGLLFFWLLAGDFAWTIKQRAVDPVAQLLMKRHEASDLLIGLLVGSLPNALGIIVGPVVAVLSDRHRGARGRRIPFLLWPTPFAFLAMVGVAYAPDLGRALHAAWGPSSPGAMACVLIVFGVFWVFFEALTSISNTVFTALINDVVPREMLGRFFGLFRAVSLIAGIIFNVFVMGHAETYYRAIFIGLGLVYFVGFSAMCLRVKEGDYPPPPPAPPHPWKGMLDYLRQCFGHRFYLNIVVTMALASLALGPISTFSVLYARKLGVSMETYGHYQALFFTCSLVLAYGIGWLADKFHPLRITMIALIGYAVVTLTGYFLIVDARSFGVFFILTGVISGVYYTGIASLGQRLFPQARFAQFSSAVGVINGVLYIIMPTALGAWLDSRQHEYRYTFLFGGLLAAVAVVAFWRVLRQVRQHGGLDNYTPPPVDP